MTTLAVNSLMLVLAETGSKTCLFLCFFKGFDSVPSAIRICWHPTRTGRTVKGSEGGLVDESGTIHAIKPSSIWSPKIEV